MNGRQPIGKIAWASIALYEIACPDGEMLCEVLDPHIKRQPLFIRAIIFYIALHAANLLPTKYDVFYYLATKVRR